MKGVRLPSFTRGTKLRHRAFIAMTRWLGAEIDDVGKCAMKRPESFGRPFLNLTHAVLRGSSAWTVGERELFAAVVSRANECPFCIGTHAEIAAQELGADSLERWADGKFGSEVTAACHFIEKLTRAPDEIGPDDVAAARAAGVVDAALVEAIHVAFVFNAINRITNALGFEHGSERERVKGASMLRRIGYRLPGFLL